tara:strand:+ start:560 stop:766 length:207 start_codon:yes stop_codon:yes gene_type:complete
VGWRKPQQIKKFYPDQATRTITRSELDQAVAEYFDQGGTVKRQRATKKSEATASRSALDTHNKHNQNS